MNTKFTCLEGNSVRRCHSRRRLGCRRSIGRGQVQSSPPDTARRSRRRPSGAPSGTRSAPSNGGPRKRPGRRDTALALDCCWSRTALHGRLWTSSPRTARSKDGGCSRCGRSLAESSSGCRAPAPTSQHSRGYQRVDRTFISLASIHHNVYDKYQSQNANLLFVVSADHQSADASIPEPQHGYVIFLPSGEDVLEGLGSQIEVLESFSFSYNRRGKFVVVVLEEKVQDSEHISKIILSSMWRRNNIFNALVVVQSKKKSTFDLFSLFPFESEECGESDAVALLDQWTFPTGFQHGDGLQLTKEPPNDLKGCSTTITVSIHEPFVIVTKNQTNNNGDTVLELEGLDLVFLDFIKEGMNFSVIFDVATDDYAKEYGRLLDGRSINIGNYFLIPHQYSYADLTTPYVITAAELFVPCSRQKPHSGSVLRVFAPSVWFALVAVLLLGAMVFLLFHKNGMESRTYKFSSLLSLCTVFQSLFTSFLIDPGYESEIETIDDVNERGLTVMFNGFMKYTEGLVGIKFLEMFKYTRHSEDNASWLEGLLKHRNASILYDKFRIEQYAAKEGIAELCAIWTYAKTGLVFLLSKGHPLLKRFDLLIRRCLEAGFLDRYWSLLKTRNILANNNMNESKSDYTVFGVLHLQNYFLFLAIGCFLSTTAFVFEYMHNRH
ncbi:hypothetical protein C0J52_13644 [Blattella germanica]|nr:hypothetical protein C0J52_13644 [Blattella germanica]